MQDRARQLMELEIRHPAKTKQIQSVLFPFSGEERVLMCLFQGEGEVLSGDLMEQTGLTTGRIANLLKQLETKGLIGRRMDTKDRRRVYVTLTEEGRSRAETVRKEAIAHCGKLLYYMNEEDADSLLAVITRLIRQP